MRGRIEDKITAYQKEEKDENEADMRAVGRSLIWIITAGFFHVAYIFPSNSLAPALHSW